MTNDQVASHAADGYVSGPTGIMVRLRRNLIRKYTGAYPGCPGDEQPLKIMRSTF